MPKNINWRTFILYIFIVQGCSDRCSIVCNMIECCNVARCDSGTKTCSVGFHAGPVTFVGGVEHMVRKRTSMYLFEFSSVILFLPSFYCYCWHDPRVMTPVRAEVLGSSSCSDHWTSYEITIIENMNTSTGFMHKIEY